MRFLSSDGLGTLRVSADLDPKTYPYAILSHTWGQDQDEVTFEDLQSGSGKAKTSWEKINFCCAQAKKDNLDYFWVDTCAINKSNHTEYSEAINSMFRWYRNAERCYVYLSDVSVPAGEAGQTKEEWEPAFRACRWFKRGWTLPELLAPASVQFFSREWIYLGDKVSLEDQIHDITGIPFSALRGEPLSQFSYEERFQWAAGRETTKREDRVYCLLGIFDVFMPLIYGEGDRAIVRLKREIMTSLEQRELPQHSVKVDPYIQNVESTPNQASAPSASSVEGYQQQRPPNLPYQENGQIEEGKPIKRIAQIQQKALLKDKLARLKLMRSLAFEFEDNGHIEERIKLLEELVQVQQKFLPEGDPDQLNTEHYLALSYEQKGQYTEAINLMEKIVQIQQKTLLEDDPHRLRAEQHLAITYGLNGRPTEAIKLLKSITQIQQKTLLEDDPDRLKTELYLATAYEQKGQYTEAIDLMEKIVQIQQKTLLEDDPDLLKAELYLATAYEQKGQHTEAINLMEKIVQIQQKTLLEDDPHRLKTEHFLATIYGLNGQYTEAINLMEKIVQIQQKILLEDDPDLLKAEQFLANMYGLNGQYTEAINLMEKIVQIEQKTLSEDDPDRLKAEQHLAIAYKQNGQNSEAIKLLKPIVQGRQEILQPQHPQRQGLGQWLRKMEKKSVNWVQITKAKKPTWFRWSKASFK